MANESGYKVAYSNQCFEYWLLIHFNYIESDLDRSLLPDMLTKELKFKYEKNCCRVFDKIQINQDTAIRNTKKIEKMHDEYGKKLASQRAPSTTVYKLVEELNNFKRK